MNLGIADAMVLARLLEAGSDVGQDLGTVCAACSGMWLRLIGLLWHAGSPALLKDYGRQRKAHNLSMMLGLDALKAMFACEPGVFSDARNMGMSVVNSLPLLKVRRYTRACPAQHHASRTDVSGTYG